MAKVRCAGVEVYADPVHQLGNGDWIMRSRQQGARFERYTLIRVRPFEVIEMAAAEMPEPPQLPVSPSPPQPSVPEPPSPPVSPQPLRSFEDIQEMYKRMLRLRLFLGEDA